MLNRLRRWWINRRRAIFRFWDGSRLRAADPFVLYRGLQLHSEFDLAAHLPLVELEDVDATRITLQAAREVFGVQAFDEPTGKGLTEAETLDLMFSFEDYLALLKKKVSPSPTWPERTAPQSSAPSTTKPGLDFSSTFRELNCGAPLTR